MFKNIEVGTATLPLTTLTDPSHEVLLNLLKTAIASDCNSAYKAITGGNVIEVAIPYQPEWLNQQITIKLPCLAVYRTSSESSRFTCYYDKLTTLYVIDYILPQMNSQWLRLENIRQAVVASIAGCALRFGHPSYNDGYRVDGYFNAMSIQSVQYGQLQGAGEIVHPSVRLTLSTTELVSQYPDPDGNDMVDLTSISSIIDTDSDGYVHVDTLVEL